jgi:hypothetical protein
MKAFSNYACFVTFNGSISSSLDAKHLFITYCEHSERELVAKFDF